MKKIYRRSISGLMALLICFTTILGGGITAFAASSSGEVAKSYSIGFPRSGDANLDYSGTWGHDELHYMNGWTSGEATWMTTLHTIGSFDGPACYCIEPGVPRLLEKTYTRYGEDYWKNYPSDYNSTIDADTIKTLLGRIMQYGYQGDLSLDWRSQNEADADKMAHMMATQVLVWETVVGERDANFNHVDPGSADAVKSVYRTSHPLYSRFSAYYDSIEASVQSHTVIPSFMSKTPNKAQTVELKWDGSQYTATLTDSNHVVSDYMSPVDFAFHLKNEGPVIRYRKFLRNIDDSLEKQDWKELKYLLRCSEDAVSSVISMDSKKIASVSVEILPTPRVIFNFSGETVKIGEVPSLTLKQFEKHFKKFSLVFLKDITKYAIEDMRRW